MITAPATTPVLEHWEDRLKHIVETMRELSRQSDPQALVRTYSERIRRLMPVDGSVSLSRRDLPAPKYRITRSTLWKESVNPWKHPDRLPVLEGGLLGELLYSDQPRIVDDLHVSPDDPAYRYFEGHHSLMALPLYDRGVALNMVVMFRRRPHGFDRNQYPEYVWMSNLFGRATHTLVLSEQLQAAYHAVDEELRIVENMQRSLLPATLPKIPTLDLAVHYQTSRRAGGDYYDFFQLPEGKWGILIADVSGHGTPAAVVMAITHAIAHTLPGLPTPPARLLTHLNHHLARQYTSESGAFVTAFYGVYDPAGRSLTYARAGHCPPRVKRCRDGTLSILDGVGSLPLGIVPEAAYEEVTQQFVPGDQIIFYTDGITEAFNPEGRMFGVERLDEVLELCHLDANGLIQTVISAVDQFSGGQPASDDQTILVAKVG